MTTFQCPIYAKDSAGTTVYVPIFVDIPTTQSVSFGQTSILPNADNGNGNLIFTQLVSITQSGILQSLSFYVTTIGGQLELGLYSTVANKPATLVASVSAFTPVAGWNTKPTTTNPTIAVGTYWLAALPSSNTLGFRKTATSQTSYTKSFTFAPLPQTFPTGAATTASQWSFYATLSITG